MSSIPERYDRDAEDYGQYWAPVLDAAARRLLDRVEPFVRELRHDPRIVDVGTGHGVLATEARKRWPNALVIGADASSGMLKVARRMHGGAEATEPSKETLRWLHAPADALGLPDASMDLIVSSFVYQLVPDRTLAFSEARRVLRPGGRLAFVTWLDRGPDFQPGVEFDEAIFDLDIEEPEEPEDEELRSGDFRSPRSAANELRRAGFKRVSANGEWLKFRWNIDTYLAYKRNYDERTLFNWLDKARARKLMARARERMSDIPDEMWVWEAEIVSAVAERP